jgi:hypothetical protein
MNCKICKIPKRKKDIRFLKSNINEYIENFYLVKIKMMEIRQFAKNALTLLIILKYIKN